MGRFRYGLDQQILVAQVPEGMEWECGSVAILAPSAQTDRWNIWQRQKSIEDIPANDLKVACYSLTDIIEPAGEVEHEVNQYQDSITARGLSRPLIFDIPRRWLGSESQPDGESWWYL